MREEGKTLAEARVEARRTPQNLRFYAGEALRLNGENYPTADGGWVLMGTSDGKVEMWPVDAIGTAEAYLRRYDRPIGPK